MWPLANYKQPFYTVYLNVSAGNGSQREADHMVSSAKAAGKGTMLLSAAGGILLTKRHQKRALYYSDAANSSSGRAS